MNIQWSSEVQGRSVHSTLLYELCDNEMKFYIKYDENGE